MGGLVGRDYNRLNGLLFISGLRGLMGNANRSSASPSAVGGRGASDPSTASRDATPSILVASWGA